MDSFEPMRPPADRHEWEDGGERFRVWLVNQETPYGPTINWNREDEDAPEEQMADAFAWEILRLRKEYDDDGAAEGARIRRELLEAMGSWLNGVTWRDQAVSVSERRIGADAAIAALQAALDRICPDGKE